MNIPKRYLMTSVFDPQRLFGFKSNLDYYLSFNGQTKPINGLIIIFNDLDLDLTYVIIIIDFWWIATQSFV